MISFLRKLWFYLNFNVPDSQQPGQRSHPLPPESKPNSTPNNLNDLQREIRAQRKFSLAEAIGREGGSFMKGESTVPRPLQATAKINRFILKYLANPNTSALSTALQSWVSQDIRVSRQLDTPLIALAQITASILAEPTTFHEFARQVAIAQGKLTGDRPYFQRPDTAPHPDADCTYQSIRTELVALLQALHDQQPQQS